MPKNEPERLFMKAELPAVTGYRRTALDSLIADGRFPPGTKIGPRRRVWTASEIAEWQKQRLAQRD